MSNNPPRLPLTQTLKLMGDGLQEQGLAMTVLKKGIKIERTVAFLLTPLRGAAFG